jgi:hypothetical protein
VTWRPRRARLGLGGSTQQSAGGLLRGLGIIGITPKGVSVFREATSRLQVEVVRTRKLAAGPASASGTVLVRRSQREPLALRRARLY